MSTSSVSTARLLTLLSLLQTRRDWPGQVLAERLEISPRTVRRDVDRLRELGYRIDAMKGPDGGYRLEAGSELPPLLFDAEQAVAIAIALGSAATLGAGIEEAALRALTTVRQVMPSRLRHRADALRFTALPAGGAGAAAGGAAAGGRDSASPEVLVALSRAIEAHEVLRFDYASPARAIAATAEAGDADTASADAARPPRRVEPHHLVVSSGRWYLLAWHPERADWRTFRVDRITPRTPTGPRFTPRAVPGGDVAAFVAARFRGSDSAAGAWPCTGSVVLHLPAAEVIPFAGDGTVEPLGPHRCRLVSGAWSWVALAASLGRFDAALEVEGPPALAEAFATLAARYTAAASSRP